MHLDRFITLSVVRPFRRALRRLNYFATRPSSLVPTLPILMYHSISDDPESGVHPYYRTCTSPRRFQEQMQWLKANGYQGVTLSEGLKWLEHSNKVGNALAPRPSPLAPRYVSITFDDGFHDFYTAAFPALQQYGFSATIYLPTAFIGDTRRTFCPSGRRTPSPRRGEGRGEVVGRASLAPRPLLSSNGRACLTWSEVRELYSAGIEFGSHTVNHPRLVESSWTAIQSEILNSKCQIECQLGSCVSSFAYPYAFPQTNRDFARRLRDSLIAAGYRQCATTIVGRVAVDADPFLLKRLPVNDADDTDLLSAKLAGAYDWMETAQSAAKQIKDLLRPTRKSADAVVPRAVSIS